MNELIQALRDPEFRADVTNRLFSSFPRQVRDGLQAASNAAASNVSGPVDILAWALRKAGAPIPQNPVMGSQWMEERGLTRPVQNSAAKVVGETFGMAGPVVAFARAPQIAGGLLRAGENLSAPRKLPGEKGAIVWHGSPHKFDKFDASKIGTGEGAQAYGHGLYLAESPDVARGYQTKLAGGSVVDSRGIPVDPTTTTADLERKLRAAGLSWDDAEKAATGWASAVFNGKTGELHPIVQQEIKALGLAPKMQGALYKVDLPDTAIARMLDWDKPLSQQAPEIRAAFSKIGADSGMTGQQAYRAAHEAAIRSGKAQPAALKEIEVVNQLRRAGIPGIRYLDGGSRGAGAGTSNYVIFPQEEGMLRILERNGQPIR